MPKLAPSAAATLALLLPLLLSAACSDDPAPASPTPDVGNDAGDDAADDAGGDATDDPADDAEPDAPPSYAGLILNEIAAAGEPTDWVELYNASPVPIDLAGVGIGDDPDDPASRVAFGAGARLAPGEHVAVYLQQDGFPGFLLGSDEAVAVFAPDGTLLDAVDWDEGQSPEGASWGRIPDASGTFKLLLHPTPGAPNQDNLGGAVCGDGQVDEGELCDDMDPDDGDGCTPGCRVEDGWYCEGAPSACSTRCGDSVIAGAEQCDNGPDDPDDACDPECRFELTPSPVVINEIVAHPEDGEDWIELLNTGADEVNLAGWTLADDQGREEGVTLTAGTRIGPGARLVFERDATGPLTFPFGLGGDDAVFLYNASGQLVDAADWVAGQVDEGSSFGRDPDGTGEFTTLTPPTRGAPNN